MIGHLLGAAGPVEAIATLLTMNRGLIHPTINYENPDPECDLDYVPNVARRKDVHIAISNGFGFGGHNAVVVLEKYEEELDRRRHDPNRSQSQPPGGDADLLHGVRDVPPHRAGAAPRARRAEPGPT